MKCNHKDVEQTLILMDDTKQIGSLSMIRKATLIEYCRDCEKEEKYYVAGGILENVEYDNA